MNQRSEIWAIKNGVVQNLKNRYKKRCSIISFCTLFSLADWGLLKHGRQFTPCCLLLNMLTVCFMVTAMREHKQCRETNRFMSLTALTQSGRVRVSY